MIGLLPERYCELAARVDGLVHGGIAKRAAEYDRAAKFPNLDFDDLHDANLLLATLPQSDGGLGYGFLDDAQSFFLIIERLAKASPSTAHCFQVHCNALQIVRAFGDDAQVARFSEPTRVTGRLLVGAGSEPGGGRHSTKAQKVSGGYVINGVKHYATNATRCDWMTVHVRAVDTGLMETFAIHTSNPGVQIDAGVWNPTGMRACVSPLLTFKDCLVPDDCVLGGSEAFYADKWLAKINFGFTANYLGAVQGIYDWSVGYLRDRGRKETEFYQCCVGELKARIDSARLLFYHAVRLIKVDLEQALLASNEAKWLAVDCFNRFAAAVGQLVGSTGYFNQHPLERMMRDMFVHTLHRRHHVGATLVGRAELGLDFDINQS